MIYKLLFDSIMPTPTLSQRNYINSIIHDRNRSKNKVYYDSEDQWNLSLWPGYVPGVKAPPVNLFYYKPVMICAPCELINGPLICDNCKSEFNNEGWCKNYRYVHSLKSGFILFKAPRDSGHTCGLEQLQLPLFFHRFHSLIV